MELKRVPPCLPAVLQLTGYGQNYNSKKGGLSSISPPHLDSIHRQSDLPPDPQNQGLKIGDFVFLPYISFITAVTPLGYINRYWETLCGGSILPVIFPSDPLPPLWV